MLNKLTTRPWMFWLILIVFSIGIVVFLTDNAKDATKIEYSEFVTASRAGHLKSVEIRELDIQGTYKEDYAKKNKDGLETFQTTGPVGEDLQDQLVANDVTVSFKKVEDNGKWQMFVIQMIFIMLLVVAFIFFMRQFQGGGQGKAMSFGKSRAKMLNENQNKVMFSDIAGIDEAKEELQEVVEFLKNRSKFTRLGGRIPKGVLLMGSPGTGKTLLARGVAGEAGVPFFSISGSDFVEMFVGVGASRVRDLFEQAKKHAPCIIFIDEIDAVGRARGSGMGGGNDEREQTLNQLLVEMDGFEANEGVIIIAATNRPDVLDKALLRPGRFDRRVNVAAPDARGREQILKIHTRRTPIGSSVDLERIARGTPGFSGADLENLVNEAALMAARKDKTQVDNIEFEEAKDKVLMGAQRKNFIISAHERRVTAFHESGHAIIALMLDQTDPVHKVTIIPRGRALGVMQQLPSEDRYSITRRYARQRITVIMGGRAAEEIVFDEFTSGPGNDIQVATDTARRMVCEWGMSEVIGPLRYADGDTNPFMGGGGGVSSRPHSEAKAQLIDEEIHRIVSEQYTRALSILRENRPLLDLMSEALLELETLDSEEIKILLESKSIDEVREYREKEREKREKEESAPKTGFSSKLKDQISDLAKPSLPDPEEAW